jgi:iron complex outermembrane receptor protein
MHITLGAALRVAAAVLLAGHATAAPAQESSPRATNLDPVVVTGSRVEAKSFDLPYSIDVVDLRASQAGVLGVNVSEVLGGVPGLVIQNRQNYAQDLQISIRGFGARSAFGVRGVKLISDGIPATNPDGQGQASTFDLDTAERIEVLRGPFATVYGNHAGGVIQSFSRDGEGAPRLTGGATAGSWDTTRARAGAEGELGGIGFVLDASRFDTGGYRDHSEATREQGFAKITMRPDANSEMRLLASTLSQPDTQDPLGVTWETYRRDPRAVEAAALLYDTRKSVDHWQTGATFERRFANDRIQFVGYGGRRSVTQFQAIPKAAQRAPRSAGGVVDFDRGFGGGAARWIAERDFGGAALTLTAGVDYDRSQDDRRGYENFAGDTLGVKGSLRRDEVDTVYSLDPYAQAVVKAGRWQFSAGVRHARVAFEVDDRYVTGANGDDGGSVAYTATTPAFGLLYAVTPSWNVYASAGAGFETPTLNELSYATPLSGFNFGLDASTSRQVEIGVKALVGGAARIDVALFHIRSEDEIVVSESFGGRTSYTNAGRTVRTGAELAAESSLPHGITVRTALTWLDASYADAFTNRGVRVPEGSRIPGVPAFTAFGEVAWQPTHWLAFGAEVIHRSKVEVNDRNDAQAAPAYTLVNLLASAEQRVRGWSFTEMLRLDNVFDQEHVGSVIVGDAQGRYYEPGAERSFYGGVRASWAF